MSALFRDFVSTCHINVIVSDKDNRRLESLVVRMLRKKKLMTSNRYGDKVVVTFAQNEPGDFSPDNAARD